MEILKWALQPERHSDILSNKSLKLTPSYKQPNLIICDLKLNVRGYEEDEIYLKNELIRKNIKRGNTLLILTNQKNTTESNIKIEKIRDIFWVRRGLTKFFDISIEDINLSLGLTSGKVQNKKKPNSHLITFEAIEKALLDRKKVSVYQTEKANGENVQISFIALIEKWVISSKNCSIVVSGIEEIDRYSDDRYSFTKLIANSWFQTVKKVELLDELKEYLNGKTMIGEYIGNKLFQHIVKYEKEEIKFYAIVENNSDWSCLSVLESFFIFNKFSLLSVGIKKIGSFETKLDLYRELKKLYKEISVSSLENGGEGSVLYFTLNNNEVEDSIDQEILQNSKTFEENQVFNLAKSQTVLSLAKIKTLEYRIYRKIREKLKAVKKGNSDFQESLQRFEKDTEKLIGQFETGKDIEFYKEEFIKAAEKTVKLKNISKKSKKNEAEIQEIEPCLIFLETSWLFNIEKNLVKNVLNLKYSPDQSDEYKPGFVFHNVLSKIYFPSIPNCYYIIAGYDQESENLYFDRFKNMKKEDCPKELQKLCKKKDSSKINKKIHEQFKSRRSLYDKLNYPDSSSVHRFQASSELELLNLIKGVVYKNKPKKQQVLVDKSKRCLMFVPIAIPSSGKSYISNIISKLIKETSEFRSIDLKEPHILQDQLEPSQKAFNYSIETIKSDIQVFLSNSGKRLIVFLEADYTLENLESLIKLFKPIREQVKIVGLLPDTFQMNLRKKSFPLSQNFLAVSLKRYLVSIPLPFDRVKIQQIIKSFKSFNSKIEEYCSAFFDSVAKLPFVNELISIPENLSQIIRCILQSDSVQDTTFDSLCQTLIQTELPELDDSMLISLLLPLLN